MRCIWLSCLILLTVYASDARAVEIIAGSVSATASGSPLAGIDLDVFDAATELSVVTVGGVTDAAGQYAVTLPGPGNYLIRADPGVLDGVADQFHNGVFLKSQALVISVAQGQTVSGINFSLPSGVIVGGSVSSGGLGLADIDIDVFASNGEFMSGYSAATDVFGSYSIGALPPGSYFISADPAPELDQFFVETFFGGSPSMLGATPVVVAGQNLFNVNILPSPGGSIRGLVTDSAGVPLAEIDIDVFNGTGGRQEQGGKTDLNGVYETSGLLPGDYLIRADPSVQQGFARTYFPGSANEDDADRIPVSAGARTDAINLTLPVGGTLSGTIRDAVTQAPLAGVDLDFFDALLRRLPSQSATTDALGAYQLGPLAPGLYYVRADPVPLTGLAEIYFDDQVALALANPVSVTAGSNAANVDIDLPLGGAMSGTVRTNLGQPVELIDMDLFTVPSDELMRKEATSGPDGSYAYDSLPPGQYKLRADPTVAQNLARIYFNDLPNKALAEPLGITALSTTSGIDFGLPLAATLSGTITDELGAPAVSVDIDVFQVIGPAFERLAQSARSDAAGSFTLTKLPPGNYVVRADPSPLLGLAEVYFGGTSKVQLATTVALPEGANLGGINIQLRPQICGDVNSDGSINATDVSLLLASLANPLGSPLPAGGNARCIVSNASAACDIVQAATLRRFVASPLSSPGTREACSAAP